MEKEFATPLGIIHYWISGTVKDTVTLVFLPGLTADHSLFEKQIDFFPGKYNCLVWDAPAHGKSRPFRLEFSMEQLAEYLHDILQTEQVARPVFVGQSLGGYISQVYMELFPNEVAGFVSVDSCPLKRTYYARWELALLKQTKWIFMSFPYKLLLKLGANGNSMTEYGRRLLEKMWSVYDKEEYCALSGHGFKIVAQSIERKKARDINCPVLLLCGKKDNAGSAKRYNRQWAKQDGYRLVWLENAGHNSNADVPEVVNAVIDEFVQEILKANIARCEMGLS